MTDLELTASNGHHIITASSREHREQLITEFFNHFETVEKSEDVVVLKRRAVTFKEQKYQERRAFDRSWTGWLLFLLFMGMVTEKEPKSDPDSREAAALAALPAGTDVIEIQL
ncbi:MAG: hypothetical protein ABL894_03670 [Hyphomicrobium sp.]